MIRAATVALAVCLFTAGAASAGTADCPVSTPETVSLPCRLHSIDQVALQFDGSASRLGLDRTGLESFIRTILRQHLPVAIQIAEPGGVARAAVPATQQGRFACELWTVGDYFPIALFVACDLGTLDGGQSISARLLGHTRHSELRKTVRIALGQVVGEVADRFRRQRALLRGM